MVFVPTLQMIVLLVLVVAVTCSSGLNPVVFMPGDGGCQVEAKLNKTTVVHRICKKTTKDYFNVWVNPKLLSPFFIDCWVDNLKLTYDNATRTTSNAPGVKIRIPGFGGTKTVEWLAPGHPFIGAYFRNIAKFLVGLGYERNVSIKGAPYDFRKAPNENQEYFVNLKKLIEDAVHDNGNQPAIFIAHSMGGPMTLHFLSKQTQAWKDKYIKSMVTLGGVWGGAVKAVKVYAVGDNLGFRLVSERAMRKQQITSPSLAWLLPSPYFWKETEVLVQTDKKNYSLSNFQQFFKDIQFLDGWEMKKDTEQFQLNMTAPGVEVHCLYGVGVDTIEKLYYKPGKRLDDDPQLVYGDGDGTVNRRSLDGCIRWKKLQKQPVHVLALPKVDHRKILRHSSVLNYIATLVNTI